MLGCLTIHYLSHLTKVEEPERYENLLVQLLKVVNNKFR